MTSKQKETYQKWKDNVNMSKSELQRFYDSEEGKEAGLSKSKASKQGIDYGRESARWIFKMKDTPVSEWSPTMWKWAGKQNSFISRMSGVEGKLYDDKGRKTRKHLALLIWGHNPEKKSKGGNLKELDKIKKQAEELTNIEPEGLFEGGLDAPILKSGGRTIAQTPSPKKDRIFGSKVNKQGSARSKKSAKQIQFSPENILKLKSKVKEYNKQHKNKVTLETLKAVYRRGLGAYSTSHRPTITGGRPNTRNAWAMARVNKFLEKKAGKPVKKAYVQDDDLLENGGKTKNENEVQEYYVRTYADGTQQKFSINDYEKNVLPNLGKGGNILLAPNGKPSNLTPEQWKLVRTPEFKAWFGDWENEPKNASKVVDSNGEPLVVFHGSSDNFNVFEIRDRKIGRRKTSTKGFYFTNSRWVASQYAGSDGFVKSYFIKILSYPTKKDKIVLEYDNIDDYLFDYGKTIEKFGYDGAIDNNGDFIVFSSNQIKLADGSNTTFDPENPDIRYDEGGIISFNKKMQEEYIDNLKQEYETIEEINERVARYYLYEIGYKYYGGVEEIEFLNQSKKPKNHFQMRMYLGDIILNTAPFIYVNDNHKVVASRTKIEVLNANFDTTKKNIKLSQGGNTNIVHEGGVSDFSKVASASSRFRPVETILFNPPLVGTNGAKLISYTWKYEMTMLPNWEGELVGKRVSDWSQAENSADTGRDIVHVYNVQMPDGTIKSVSSESVPILLGFIDREQKKVFGSLATASKTLAKNQMKLAIMEAQEKEYEDLYKKFEQEPKPPIEIADRSELPKISGFIFDREIAEKGYSNIIFYKMGDAIVSTDNIYIKSKEEYDNFIKLPPSKYIVEKLTSNWISNQVLKAGGKRTYGLYDLRNKVERQKRKVESMLKGEKLENGGSLDSKVMYFWHGGNLDEYNDVIAQKSGRYEYGAGLYLTTELQVAIKYAKGSRRLYKIGVETGTEISDAVIDYDKIKLFIDKYVIGSKKVEVKQRLSKYIIDGKVRASYLNNIILNEKAIKPTNTYFLREFFVQNGIDYELVDNAYGWGETMMVLYNMNKIVDIQIVKQSEAYNMKLENGGKTDVFLAPNGKPSNLTPEQYRLVRTPEFKAWFGDWENNPENASKVVDENGEPLVVYHFSNVEFNVFEIKGLSDGFFFTKNIEDEEFSQKGWLKSQGLTYEQAIEKGYDLKYEKAKPYFLKIKQFFTQSNVKKSVWSTPWFENRIIEWAKKDKKNDGVEFLREIDNKQIIVAFYPNQIKLADGSNTTFDANNPDIRYAKGGQSENKIALPDTYASEESLKRVLDQQGYELSKKVNHSDMEKIDLTISEVAEKHSLPVETLRDELVEGIKTEMEHTNNPEEAKKIALDHLAENPQYYQYLQRMEAKMKQETIDKHYDELTAKYANGGEISAMYSFRTPTGEPTRLSYIQQVLVRTSQFKNWFGDWEKAANLFEIERQKMSIPNATFMSFNEIYSGVSNVIDMVTLEPKVVYHGTGAGEEFYQFDVSRESGKGRPYAYFADNREYSQNFVLRSQGFLYECFLNIRNPFMAINSNFYGKRDTYPYWISVIGVELNSSRPETPLKDILKELNDSLTPYFKSVWRNETNEMPFWTAMSADSDSIFKRYLMLNKFDGIRYAEEFTNNYDIDNPAEFTRAWCIFDAKQVKLADGRNIDFSPFETDIRLADGGNLEPKVEIIENPDQNMNRIQMMRKNMGLDSFETQKFNDGGTVYGDGKNTKNAKDGGYFKGKSHANGGIKAINIDTGQIIEVEGNEVIINKRSVADPTKREFEGEMLTNKEILSKINQMGGGVKFESGGKLHDSCGCSGKKYKFGGETLEDYVILSRINKLSESYLTPEEESINQLNNMLSEIYG